MKNSRQSKNEIHADQILQALFELARADRQATPRLLYGVTGIPTQQLRRVLSELDRIGLVDVERCRLTMPGLVLAASSAARLKRQEDEEPDSQQIDRAA